MACVCRSEDSLQVGSLLLPCESQKWNSGCQAWQQGTFTPSQITSCNLKFWSFCGLLSAKITGVYHILNIYLFVYVCVCVCLVTHMPWCTCKVRRQLVRVGSLLLLCLEGDWTEVVQLSCKCLNLLGHLVHLTFNFCIETWIKAQNLWKFIYLFSFLCRCVYLGACGSRGQSWIHWNCSYRQLWAAQCRC